MRLFACVWALLPMLMLATPVLAQDIDDLDEGVVMETPFEAGIEKNAWEFNIQIGYMNLDQVLWSTEGIIVDLEDPQQAIFGDTELVGEVSFCPQFRINRTFGTHWAWENSIGFTLGDFDQSISNNTIERWVDTQDELNYISENELERGSYFVMLYESSLTWYPRSKGYVLPFLSAGIGQHKYYLDSEYIEGSGSGLAFSYGAGLRIIGDDLFSIRVEVRNYHTAITYDVSDTYATIPNLRADGLIDFPVSHLVDADTLSPEEKDRIRYQLDLDDTFNPDRFPVPVESYEEHSYINLWISLGFSASF